MCKYLTRKLVRILMWILILDLLYTRGFLNVSLYLEQLFFILFVLFLKREIIVQKSYCYDFWFFYSNYWRSVCKNLQLLIVKTLVERNLQFKFLNYVFYLPFNSSHSDFNLLGFLSLWFQTADLNLCVVPISVSTDAFLCNEEKITINTIYSDVLLWDGNEMQRLLLLLLAIENVVSYKPVGHWLGHIFATFIRQLFQLFISSCVCVSWPLLVALLPQLNCDMSKTWRVVLYLNHVLLLSETSPCPG